MAAGIRSVDRVASDGGKTSVNATVQLPPRVAGTTYTIEIVPGSPNELVLTSTDPSLTVRVPVKTTAPLDAGRVDGGDVFVTYDTASGTLEVGA